MLLPFVLLVLPVLFQPILVTASTVSVVSDVTMETVIVTSVPICRSVETSIGHFFTSCQPCYVVQLMYVNCVYIVVMFVI